MNAMPQVKTRSKANAEPRGISAKQERAIAALLSEPSIKHAAAAAQVEELTLWRWLKEEAFDNAYRDARHKAFLESTVGTGYRLSKAVSVIESILKDKKQPVMARIAAAEAVFQIARGEFKFDDDDDDLLLAALEEEMEQTTDLPN
jgi:hypothetical protein